MCLQSQLGIYTLDGLKDVEANQLQRIGIKRIKLRRFMAAVGRLNQRSSGAIAHIEQGVVSYNEATLKQWFQADGSFDFEDPEPGAFEIIGLPEENRCFEKDKSQYYEYEPANSVDLTVVVVNSGDGDWSCGVGSRVGNRWTTTRVGSGKIHISITLSELQAMQTEYRSRKEAERLLQEDEDRKYQEEKARQKADRIRRKELARARIAAEEAAEEAAKGQDADLDEFLVSAGASHVLWELKVPLQY